MCIPLEAGCFSSFRTPFLLGGIFDETEEEPIRRLSAAEPIPFLHDTLTDTAIAAMEKRNEYLRFCREISTISIPDLSLPSQMRRGNRKGIRGGCHRAVVAALLVTAGLHSRPPLRVPLRFAPVPAHPARRCAPRGPYFGRKRPRPPTPHWGVLGCPSRSRICCAMFPEIVSPLVDPWRRRSRRAGTSSLVGRVTSVGHKEPMTIATALKLIQKNELILPAIQREYVWKPSQVIKLFDSVLRGYPVGSFLSWKVLPETVGKFKFYGFMKDYSGYDKKHNPVVDIPLDREVIAALDGQQRLTSLNIGLRGTYAYRNPRAWANKAWSYPERRLFLNLHGEAPENEAGLKYHLAFLTKEQIEQSADDTTKKWFPISDIFDASEAYQMAQLPMKYGVGNEAKAVEMISLLWQEVHHDQSLHFYEETDQDIERVLDIFVRVNSGGTVLSYSDLLMSIATAQWKDKDARAAVHDLVDALNTTGQGFDFSQDTVLKSGLVLADVGDVGFKVKNFTTANMAILEARWDDISTSLRIAAELLSDFGLAGGTLAADSVLIPVAYYVHRRGLTPEYRVSDKPADRADRAALRSWVLRSLIVRGVWGSGLDTLLRDLREVIRRDGHDGFPVEPIERAMALRGKSLEVTDALIEDILGLAYGGGRTGAVLATLFDHVDTRMQYHEDHVFPRSQLDARTLKAVRDAEANRRYSDALIDELVAKRDLLPNLELLPGPENIRKSDVAPDVWVIDHYAGADERAAFIKANSLPAELPHDADDFLAFFDARRELLVGRIKDKLRTRSVAVQTAVAAAPTDLDAELGEGDLDD
ncbi:DUF262 domain-containing protein [Gulosibacter sediminis]|uniref:DUF262 domain-containing protein n=1 Tax=Gulosibacter sediminis TaxID=1729695 RepID=UPI0024A851A6|nr:DUF262 domain-containing protein [Gulosibacter sediminis]